MSGHEWRGNYGVIQFGMWGDSQLLLPACSDLGHDSHAEWVTSLGLGVSRLPRSNRKIVARWSCNGTWKPSFLPSQIRRASRGSANDQLEQLAQDPEQWDRVCVTRYSKSLLSQSSSSQMRCLCFVRLRGRCGQTKIVLTHKSGHLSQQVTSFSVPWAQCLNTQKVLLLTTSMGLGWAGKILSAQKMWCQHWEFWKITSRRVTMLEHRGQYRMSPRI